MDSFVASPENGQSGDLTVAEGLSSEQVAQWTASEPRAAAGFRDDCRQFGEHWRLGADLVGGLPVKSRRTAGQQAAAEAIHRVARRSRERFLERHAETLYDQVTAERTRFFRVDELAQAVAEAVPGLLPSREQLDADAGLPQRDKEGSEIDQGLFFARILAGERSGRHLCHAMLLPRTDSAQAAVKLEREGHLDLGAARLTREGRAIVLTMSNPRFLHAEDETTIDAMEIATDVAILDPLSEIAVLRGDVLPSGKYAGRRVTGTGINLTHLYRGRIPFLWFLRRELGFVHKFMRGVAQPEGIPPDDVSATAVEKPWIGVVEAFAIGGHCQYLLTMDFVLAAADAFMTLPARKEGIIPGLSNLRLPRFVGDRIARQAIQYERRIDCDSPEGRMICDEVVPPDQVDTALPQIIERLTSSGAVSIVGNRRAFRVAQEPLDMFREYCAVYAREQAYCHFSPALISNLERHWNAQSRRI